MSEDITIVPKTAATTEQAEYDAKEAAPLAGFLGIEKPSDADSKQLETILNYFKDGKEMTQSELLNHVKQLELRLGTPAIGERRIDLIYRYVKLNSQIQGLEKERNALLR